MSRVYYTIADASLITQQTLEQIPNVVREWPCGILHMTGSRSVGMHGPKSDWDFYCQYDDVLYSDMIKAGWMDGGDRSYDGDPLLAALLAKDNVHVQMIKPNYMEAKHQMQAYLRRHRTSLYRMSKDQRREEYQRLAYALTRMIDGC